MKFLFSICAFLFLVVEISYAQKEVIELKNSSFEGMPRKGEYLFVLDGWNDCGMIYFRGETPPDVHPAGAAWQNIAPTYDGRTYVGLVVRDNDSWESISQRLETGIEAEKCYKFSIAMMRSDKYVSATRLNTDKVENYQEPAVLRIWGGSGYCNQRELLAESDPVTNRNWEEFEFEFNPQYNHRYFTLEVFYKTPVLFPYNGHILIDKASSIERISCPDEEPLVAVEEIPEPQPQVPPHKRRKRDEPTSPVTNPDIVNEVPQQPKIMEELDRKTVKKGQIIKIKNLYFDTDESELDTRSHFALDEIFNFLKQNPDINIEIGGHTNGLCQEDFCDKLSEDRAKVVAQYLVRKGISAGRLQYKGYGKRRTIASDRTAFGRQKNQRVEIKITDITDT